RLGAQYEISILFLSVILYGGVLGTAVWLWMQGQAELGIIAATTAMVLKLNSIAEFMMWQTSALFENVGTIQDGMRTLGRKISIEIRPDAKELQLKQGEIR